MSILEVAREAGVSVATVSRVFNVPDKVAPATREHVENIARTLGYLPNASARTLRTQRSRVLGVVLPTLTNPVFAECLEGIAQAAVAGGYAISPFTTDYRLDQEDRAVNLLLAGNVDGMILVVSNPATSTALQRLAEVGLPYVLAYNHHPDHPCVSVHSELAVAGVVTHLATPGPRGGHGAGGPAGPACVAGALRGRCARGVGRSPEQPRPPHGPGVFQRPAGHPQHPRRAPGGPGGAARPERGGLRRHCAGARPHSATEHRGATQCRHRPPQRGAAGPGSGQWQPAGARHGSDAGAPVPRWRVLRTARLFPCSSPHLNPRS